MTNPKQLRDLADRCEKATGPDRELDCRIRAVVERANFPDAAAFRMGRTWGAGALKGKGRGWRAFGLHFEMRGYTASLDAAMTLVPEGWGFSIRRLCDGSSSATAYAPCTGNGLVHAATPALALCAAALRAQASMIEGDK